MAIKFQYNKTSLGDLGKQLKMRQKALPTIKSKESALRSEVKKAKEAAQEFRSQLSRLEAEYDYMVSLWGEFDCDLLRIADIELTEQKIAGVRTPVLREIVYEEKPYDLFSSPVWYAAGIDLLKRLPDVRLSSTTFSTARWSCWISHAVKPLRRSTFTRRYRFPVTRMPYARSNDSLRTRRTSRNRHRKS